MFAKYQQAKDGPKAEEKKDPAPTEEAKAEEVKVEKPAETTAGGAAGDTPLTDAEKRELLRVAH